MDRKLHRILILTAALALLPATANAGPREDIATNPPKVTLPRGWQAWPVNLVRCPVYLTEVACIVMVESWEETTGYRFDATVYMPAAWTGLQGREALLHEYGHAFDRLHLDDTERLRFTEYNHLPPPPAWWEPLPDAAREFKASPGELFADAYAFCGLTTRERQRIGYAFLRPDAWDGRPVGQRRLTGTAYGWMPTIRQYRATCRLIAGAA